MKDITQTRRKVMLIGNQLHIKGMSLSEALKRAWKIIKSGITTKVKGVTFGNAQKAIEHLTRYSPEDIIIDIKRDSANLYDSNAIEVYAGVKDKGTVKIGFLPAPLAFILSKCLDEFESKCFIQRNKGQIRYIYELWHRHKLTAVIKTQHHR